MTISTQRFLVAKYIDDLTRMEPRNIGVILLAAGMAEARFLSPQQASFIKDKKLYQRWVDFWMDRVNADSIRMRNGVTVSPSDLEFCEALLESQRGNYILYDSGVVPDALKKAKLASVTEVLFSQLERFKHGSSGIPRLQTSFECRKS